MHLLHKRPIFSDQHVATQAEKNDEEDSLAALCEEGDAARNRS
jgi:hypothetical protein